MSLMPFPDGSNPDLGIPPQNQQGGGIIALLRQLMNPNGMYQPPVGGNDFPVKGG